MSRDFFGSCCFSIAPCAGVSTLLTENITMWYWAVWSRNQAVTRHGPSNNLGGFDSPGSDRKLGEDVLGHVPTPYTLSRPSPHSYDSPDTHIQEHY